MLEPITPEQRAWERSYHRAITSDVIWKLDVYRSSLFLLVNARDDQFASVRRPLDLALAGQLVRSAGSISANLGEGYSRSTHADRLRFFSYALGSTRECVSWYEASLGAIDLSTRASHSSSEIECYCSDSFDRRARRESAVSALNRKPRRCPAVTPHNPTFASISVPRPPLSRRSPHPAPCSRPDHDSMAPPWLPAVRERRSSS